MYQVPTFPVGSTQKDFAFSWIRVSQEICEKPLHGNPSQFLRKTVNQVPWCHTTSWAQGARPCPASLQPQPRLAQTQCPHTTAWIHSSTQEAQTRPKPFVMTAVAKIMSDEKTSGEQLQSQEGKSRLGDRESPVWSWAWSRQAWTGILSATVGQSAHGTINNTRESFGSHRAIYLTTLFQLVEQVELLLKGTSVPLLGASSPAPGLGLLGRWQLCSLLGWEQHGLGTVWGLGAMWSQLQCLSTQESIGAGTAEAQLAWAPAKDSLQALAECGRPQAPRASTSLVTHPQTKDEELTTVTVKVKEQNLPWHPAGCIKQGKLKPIYHSIHLKWVFEKFEIEWQDFWFAFSTQACISQAALLIKPHWS